jgi:hypothetical protein
MKSTVFWVLMLCSSGRVWYVRETYCFQLQGQRVSQARNQQKEAASRVRRCYFSKMLEFLRTTWHYNPEHCALYRTPNVKVIKHVYLQYKNKHIYDILSLRCHICPTLDIHIIIQGSGFLSHLCHPVTELQRPTPKVSTLFYHHSVYHWNW